MFKSSLKHNALIKRKALVLMLHEKGINRINPAAMRLLEEEISSDIEKKIDILRERMIIQGRRTLLKEDIE